MDRKLKVIRWQRYRRRVQVLVDYTTEDGELVWHQTRQYFLSTASYAGRFFRILERNYSRIGMSVLPVLPVMVYLLCFARVVYGWRGENIWHKAMA